jgi:hypothetical protein
MILAGGGPIWMQKKYVKILQHSKSLANFKFNFLRLDPRANFKMKKLWNYAANVKFTDENESLRQCIARSKLVISFSISAAIVSIRQNRPTIFCIPEDLYVPAWHNFLISLPMIKVVKTSHMLDASMGDSEFLGHKKVNYTKNQWEYFDYAVGKLDTKKNLGSLLSKLSTEWTWID